MKKVLSSIVCMCMILCMMTTLPVSVSAAGEPYVTHSLPKTMKVGQNLYDLPDSNAIIHYHNLTPNRYVLLGENDLGDALYELAFQVHYGADPEMGTVDSQGNINRVSYFDFLDILYRPGTIVFHPIYLYTPVPYYDPSLFDWDKETPVGDPIRITVETPIITHNAPTTAKVNSSLTLKTELTNTALTNEKVSKYAEAIEHDKDYLYCGASSYHSIAYQPTIEIVEGKDLVKQSKQDYTNTLHTSETLTFQKAGTVKLKVTYRQINTCGINLWRVNEDGSYKDMRYNPEKIITIQVKDNSTTSVSGGVTTPSNNNTSTETSTSETSPTEQTSSPSVNEQPVTIADEATGIKINADNSVVPEGTTMIANAITEGEQLDKVKEALKDVSNRFSAFDLSLEKDNVKIQPTGKVTVSIPIPSGYDQSRLAIYYIADDGTKTELPSTIQENNISFETDHFSTYVVAERLAAPTNAPGAEKNNATLWIVLSVVVGILLLGAGGAVWFFKFRKKPSENE